MAKHTLESVPEASKSEQAARLLDAFRQEIDEQSRGYYRSFDIKSSPSFQKILEFSRAQQVPVVLEAIARLSEFMRKRASQKNGDDTAISASHLPGFRDLISALLRKNLPFQIEDMDRLLQLVSDGRSFYLRQLSLASLLRIVENFCRERGVPDCLRAHLEGLRDEFRAQPDDAELHNAVKRLDQLLAPVAIAVPHFILTTDEAWTRYLSGRIDVLEPPIKAAWHALLLHCNSAEESKPSRKWLQQADALVQKIGATTFAAILSGVLAQIGQPGVQQVKEFCGYQFPQDPTLIHNKHSDLLRGLIWCASLVGDDSLTAAVGEAAAACFKKIPGVGPRAPKIGNACLSALSAMSSPAAVGQLSRLKSRAKHVSVRKQLDKALDTAADKIGMSAVEMEELAVPTCGLSEVGAHRLQLGDTTALLEVTGGSRAQLTWVRPDGKQLKSVPAWVKENFAADLKALKQSEKEVNKLLPAQRDRLEQLFLQERTWSYSEFRSRYLDHPVVGVLARRLIWRFSDGSNASDGIWLDGQIVDDRDQPLSWVGPQTCVALWHPLTCGVEQVQAWRDWLDRHQVRQPFKQAYREIYILTDAERRTNTYSNRFAAHIIRQHQFSALCQQRGWRYKLQGQWDSHNIPTLHLPHWNLRVEYWVQSLADESGISGHGIYLHLSTDQVRFYRQDDVAPMPLADVPALVFSEVMRDVDLFVGVASVGNDPNWSGGGPAGQYRDYWQSYSFGDLSQTAQTRKAVLERIVPRLKIAERCSFSEKFLVVRGNLRSYKIHLGSGNILMSPNDQYLCIVPKASSSEGGGKVFLPFEGDNLLSIILSKAILLAEDSEIKDPSITNQIRRI